MGRQSSQIVYKEESDMSESDNEIDSESEGILGNISRWMNRMANPGLFIHL
jgi:hypothetical protein